MIIGFKGFNIKDIIYLSIGVFSGGCEPSVSNELRPTLLLVKENNGIAVIRENNVLSIIYDGYNAPTGIILNQKHGEIYMHTFNVGNERVEGYLTRSKIDPRIFAGLYACMIGKGSDQRKAFLEVMDTLALGEGDPLKYMKTIISEHKVFHRLNNALNRLIKNEELLRKIIYNKLIIGGRSLGNTAYVSAIIKTSHGFIKECIEPISISTYKEYKWIQPNKFFICGLPNEIMEFASKYGSEKHVDPYMGNCIVGDDAVRLVILLEKYLSST
ncbi:hypothetical protein Smar_0193 [Staphylothermus marinus F1]|uniref:Uncharacterized protein n=1 Tax=Staphylothermus marinus (strain ATCC 43588 / DSM 3639 / JCM 9404 / F1) TaxID=399550 RepID=A3DKZ6_STAMF|nr:hypothetical protein [Staphylothermus marinus]ABN69306.1 hypothetical protein Smar_0193 [Staphylothermus marinus F1]